MWWWGVLGVVLAVTVVPTEPLWSQAGSVQGVSGAGVLSLSGAGMYEPQREAVRLTLIANALMFAPLPVLQTSGGRRNLRPWALVGQYAALSALIELAQLAALAGRSADVDDVLCNTAGAALGVGCAVAGRWPGGTYEALGPIRGTGTGARSARLVTAPGALAGRGPSGSVGGGRRRPRSRRPRGLRVR
ncbi:VanZ family protein [Streptomyces sp. BBFR102]|uniref:VanZ family protein n=1 Tax=Streptomyces sp. BBFR102 TaxID=3448171 RepID=UPI003F52DA0B